MKSHVLAQASKANSIPPRPNTALAPSTSTCPRIQPPSPCIETNCTRFTASLCCATAPQVLTVIVDGVSKISGVATHACLNLVDLAGSERLKSSKAEGEQSANMPGSRAALVSIQEKVLSAHSQAGTMTITLCRRSPD